MLTLHGVSSIPHTAVVDFYHPTLFFPLPGSTAPSLWNKSSFHVGEWWKKPRRVSPALTLSLSCTTLNPVLRGVVMYCVCRFIKHALHRSEVPALLHVHILLPLIINTAFVCPQLFINDDARSESQARKDTRPHL